MSHRAMRVAVRPRPVRQWAATRGLLVDEGQEALDGVVVGDGGGAGEVVVAEARADEVVAAVRVAVGEADVGRRR